MVDTPSTAKPTKKEIPLGPLERRFADMADRILKEYRADLEAMGPNLEKRMTELQENLIMSMREANQGIMSMDQLVMARHYDVDTRKDAWERKIPGTEIPAGSDLKVELRFDSNDLSLRASTQNYCRPGVDMRYPFMGRYRVKIMVYELPPEEDEAPKKV